MIQDRLPEHFEGKDLVNHLKDARQRGSAATCESHAYESPSPFCAGADAAKETALVFLITWALRPTLPFTFFFCLAIGMLVWKTGRSALLGWNRLERLHRVIEEERFEIEHHRDQERQELQEMYVAKGFSGTMLDHVVDVLMADDNRLLRVMLEEELGLTLEVHEHPLKQALGAFLGTLLAFFFCITSLYFWPTLGPLPFALLIVMASSVMAARYEKRAEIHAAIWNGSLSLFASGAAHLSSRLFA